VSDTKPVFPNHWGSDRLVDHAQAADRIADNCRPDNPHQHGFREQAFYARKSAREGQ